MDHSSSAGPALPLPHQDYLENSDSAFHVSEDYHDSAYYAVHNYPYPSTLLQQHNECAVTSYLPSVAYHLHDDVLLPENRLPTPYTFHVDQPQVYPQPPEAIHIHAPIPISAYSTLLPSIQHHTPTPQPTCETMQDPTSSNLASEEIALSVSHEDLKHHNPVDFYANVPQTMFPTPCELLTELSTPNYSVGSASCIQQHIPTAVPTSEPPSTPSTPSTPPSPLSWGDFEPEAGTLAQDTPRKVHPQSLKKPENQRKAYFRSVADKVGFQPTDPDTITSHDKKRYYLECMEHYVLWLHEQTRLVGAEPLQFERVSAYGALDIRSIRTLLVHMQDECRDLRLEVSQEERAYLELERQVLELEKESAASDTEIEVSTPPAGAHLDARRHSIASGMIPMNDSWHTTYPTQTHT